MPSLLLGYYAWYVFVAPDVFVSANQLWELMRPFTPPADLDTSGSCSGVVDGKRAAEVLQSASLAELSSNDEAAGGGYEKKTSTLRLWHCTSRCYNHFEACCEQDTRLLISGLAFFIEYIFPGSSTGLLYNRMGAAFTIIIASL